MAVARQDLVHRRTRNAFRDFCSDFGVVRQIERTVENEGLDAAQEDHDWYRDGQRRGTFDRHTDGIDWTNPGDVRKVLNAFEEIMRRGADEFAARSRAELARHLQRDGYAVDPSGRIRSSASAALAQVPLEELRDPSAILEYLERIVETTDRDPAVAISGARAIIEATTKLVLLELGVAFNEKADVPELVKAAQKALKLHPDTLAPTAAGVEITRRILSNLSQLAIGVAELRNQYGPDHGRSRAVVGLAPRHAHLAVGSAATYCRMLLETLAARRA